MGVIARPTTEAHCSMCSAPRRVSNDYRLPVRARYCSNRLIDGTIVAYDAALDTIAPATRPGDDPMPDDNIIDLKEQRLQRAWARAEAQGYSCDVFHVVDDDMC